MFFLAVNIIKKNCVIGKQGFSLFPFFVLGIVPIFANDNYTLTGYFLHMTKGSKNTDAFIQSDAVSIDVAVALMHQPPGGCPYLPVPAAPAEGADGYLGGS